MRHEGIEMACPLCFVPLTMAERSGVEVDYCPKCRGVWLDRGELDKILERAATLDREPVRPRYDEDDRRGDYSDGYSKHYGKKPKSRWDFLKEILD